MARPSELARHLTLGREGRVTHIIWSSARRNGTETPHEGYWAAKVTFKKAKRHGNARRTISYNVPLSALDHVKTRKKHVPKTPATKAQTAGVLPFRAKKTAGTRQTPARRRRTEQGRRRTA